jgi:hypothetical protein
MEVTRERISQDLGATVVKPTDARRLLTLLFISTVTLMGCIHWPDIATDCESYGVIESGEPMGTIVTIEPLFSDQLDIQCAGVTEAAAHLNPDARISGCAIPHDNGVVRAYYWTGDRCAMNHELCHAKHGSGHTERYLRELQAGVPMPYCPENQLWPR